MLEVPFKASGLIEVNPVPHCFPGLVNKIIFDSESANSASITGD